MKSDAALYEQFFQFLEFDPRKPAALEKSLKAHQGRGITEALANVLRSVNTCPVLSGPVAKNIELLRDPATAALVTGQQPGLFFGPLFTYYKAVSAILNARELSKRTGTNVVPVFWVQSEDHDFDEINIATIPAPETKRFALTARTADSKASLSHETLSGEVEALTTSFIEALPSTPERDRLAPVLRRAYAPGRSIVDAFTEVLSELTREDGLVIFNPRAPGAAKLLLNVFGTAFEKRKQIDEALHARQQQIAHAGLTPQVTVRERSPLFFLHVPDGASARYRIEEEESGFKIVGRNETISESEIEALLNSSPDRFSSSAILRPIAQDSLFPNAMYVGGEAELRYYAQVSSLSGLFQIPPMGIVPRARFVIIDEKSRQILEQLNLAASLFTHDELEILKKIPNNRAAAAPEVLESAVLEKISGAWRELEQAFLPVDKTLVQALDRSKAKTEEQVRGAIARYQQALLRADEIQVERVRRVQRMLYPGKVAQEREYSSLYYIARYGAAFRESLEKAFEPFSGSLKEVTL